jgi:BirA family biotin operon repressor/biotin-[acetyl-CoA-carboxylase] ligase
MWIPKQILYFDQLPSTNEHAHRLAKEGYEEGTLIIAKTQTMGKGRMGRRWVSPPGGIYLSLILRPRISPTTLPFLSLLGGGSVVSAIRDMFKIDAGLKWPNDILLNMKKVGGILLEGETKGEEVDFVILGIGVNANIRREELPERPIWPATSIMEEMGERVDCEELTRRILISLGKGYHDFIRDGPQSLLREWSGMDLFIGKPLIMKTERGEIEGEGMGVDLDGAYRVRLRDGRVERVIAGEITFWG